jgi:glucokinase
MILAGDIGGTNTRLALFELNAGAIVSIAKATFTSNNYANLEEIVDKFRSTYPQHITQACFGVAGPVKHSRCDATNLPWVVDAQVLANLLDLQTVGLINDLEANVLGISILNSTNLVTLNPGEADAEGNAALIAAGTGLGEAGLYWDGRHYQPIASEGGHADFAPSNELEIELLRYLMARFGRVSWERVLSGPGLYNIYQFLRDTGRGNEPNWLATEIQELDPPSAISQAALSGQSSLCDLTLELFIALYGAEAGNLALTMKATGGLFIGGGIAPKLIERIDSTTTFMDAFTAKGRMRSLLAAIPVQVIMFDKTALWGAAVWASNFSPSGFGRESSPQIRRLG